MPKYVSLFKYTADAYKGFLKEKASARTAVLKQMVDGFGGRLESIYWGGGGEYSGVPPVSPGELNHRTQNTLATVQAIAVQTLRGEGFWLPSAPRRGLWCMCGHVRQRKRARKTVTPLLRDRVAVFDESDISESCLELDPNAKVSG
jgi:uncharacterized protein with GYD domain